MSEHPLPPVGGKRRRRDGRSVSVMWELTLGWNGDRLEPAWSPPTVDHLQGLLDAVGLTDPFWQLT